MVQYFIVHTMIWYYLDTIEQHKGVILLLVATMLFGATSFQVHLACLNWVLHFIQIHFGKFARIDANCFLLCYSLDLALKLSMLYMGVWRIAYMKVYVVGVRIGSSQPFSLLWSCHKRRCWPHTSILILHLCLTACPLYVCMNRRSVYVAFLALCMYVCMNRGALCIRDICFPYVFFCFFFIISDGDWVDTSLRRVNSDVFWWNTSLFRWLVTCFWWNTSLLSVISDAYLPIPVSKLA